jgi:hypothetical protein
MGKIKSPQPVKLIVSAFAPGDALLAEARQVLVDEWGEIDLESDLLPFDHTSYYQDEFGTGLVRRIWSFKRLLDPGTLAKVKLRTNELEQRWTMDGQRKVNLDPGYISSAKLVLATTKNHGHRIYLGTGIYAEVTLQYRGAAYRPWPWTYPDYATPTYCDLMAAIRQRYLHQLRDRPQSVDQSFRAEPRARCARR